MEFEEEIVNSNEERFNRASNYLQHLVNKLDQATLLSFYGLYKQGTVGPCNTSKPGIFSIQARAKWNAWNDLKDMSKQDAMASYITKLTEIEPNWDDSNLLEEGEAPKKAYWVSVSTPVNNDDDDGKDSAAKTLIDHVKDGNIETLKGVLSTISNSDDVNEWDEHGLGAIHWAADRGNADILELLIKHGVDVNQRDSEGGQTALHYAASCGHLECVKVLLKHNADKTITDNESSTCLDVALESNEEKILELLR